MIVQSQKVQWHWTLVSQCMDSEDEAIQLLVTLGNSESITATWMEIYKQEKKETTKKKGVRKELGSKYTRRNDDK